jgi:hypothetical protein
MRDERYPLTFPSVTRVEVSFTFLPAIRASMMQMSATASRGENGILNTRE